MENASFLTRFSVLDRRFPPDGRQQKSGMGS